MISSPLYLLAIHQSLFQIDDFSIGIWIWNSDTSWFFLSYDGLRCVVGEVSDIPNPSNIEIRNFFSN